MAQASTNEVIMDSVANRLHSCRAQELCTLIAEAERTYEAIRAKWLAPSVINGNREQYNRIQRTRHHAWQRVQRRRKTYLQFLYGEVRP